MEGTVKWFNDKLGYGFIETVDSDKDIFIHYTEIKKDGYKTLNEGDIVKFIFDKDNYKATNIEIIKTAKVSLKI